MPRRSAHHAVGNLEERVGELEDGEDVAHLHRREPEIALMPGASVAMHARSRYVIIASAVASATTR